MPTPPDWMMSVVAQGVETEASTAPQKLLKSL